MVRPIRQPPFSPADDAPLRAPTTIPNRYPEKGQPNTNKRIFYLDVFAATPPGISNQIEVSSPSILEINGWRTDQFAGQFHDIGAMKFWLSTDNGPAEEFGYNLAAGPYYYMPKPGRYYLRGALAGTPLGGTLSTNGTFLNCSVFQDIDPQLGAALMNEPRSRITMTTSETVGAAVAQACVPPLVANVAQAPATPLLTFGNAGRIKGVLVSNSGAGAAFVAVNMKTVAAGVGINLPVNSPPVYIPMRGISTLYAFSTAGTTLSITWEYF